MAVNVQRGNDVRLDGYPNLVGGVFRGSASIGYWYHCFWRLRRPYIVVRFGSLGRKPEVVGSKLYELRVVGLPLAQY